jgi:hypothetical protein
MISLVGVELYKHFYLSIFSAKFQIYEVSRIALTIGLASGLIVVAGSIDCLIIRIREQKGESLSRARNYL